MYALVISQYKFKDIEKQMNEFLQKIKNKKSEKYSSYISKRLHILLNSGTL